MGARVVAASTGQQGGGEQRVFHGEAGFGVVFAALDYISNSSPAKVFFNRMTTLRQKHAAQAGAALLLAVAIVALFARLALTGLALIPLLQVGGASEVKFHVTGASPWRSWSSKTWISGMQDPGNCREAPGVATRALADLQVAGHGAGGTGPRAGYYRRLDTNPWAWSTYQNGTAAAKPMKNPGGRNHHIEGELVVVIVRRCRTRRYRCIEGAARRQRAMDRAQAHRTRAWPEGRGGAFDLATKGWPSRCRKPRARPENLAGFRPADRAAAGGTVGDGGKLTGRAEGRLAEEPRRRTAPCAFAKAGWCTRNCAVAAEGIEADLAVHPTSTRVPDQTGRRADARAAHTGALPLRDIKAGGGASKAPQNRRHARRAHRPGRPGCGGALFKYFSNLRELDAGCWWMASASKRSWR